MNLRFFSYAVIVLSFSQMSLQKAQAQSSSIQIQKCIESTCGPAEKNISAYDIAYRAFEKNSRHNKEWETNWRPMITNVIQWEMTLDQERAKRVLHLLNDFPNLLVESRMKPLLALSFVFTQIQPQMEKIIRVSEKGYEVDLNQLQTAFNGDTVLAHAARVALEELAFPAMHTIGISLTDYLTMSFMGQGTQQAQIQFAEKIYQNIQVARSKLPEKMLNFFIQKSDLQLLSQARKGQELSRSEGQTLLSLYDSSNLLLLVFSQGKLNSALQAVDLQKFRNFNIEKIKSILELGLSKQHRQKKQAKILDYCRNKWIPASTLDLPEDKILKAKNMIEAVKKAGQEVVKNYVSGSSLVQVQNKIRNTTFQFPDTATHQLKSFRKNVQGLYEGYQEGLVYLKDHDDIETRQLLLVSSLQSSKEDFDDEESIESETMNSCDELTGYELDDYALSTFGRVSISAFSIVYPDAGVSIVAHELGHVVSSALKSYVVKSAPVQNSLMCVENRNPFQTRVSEALGEGTFTEEDWADYFSSQVLKQLKIEGSPFYSNRNLGCALIHDKGSSYGENTIEPNDGDVHSSGIMRLLQIGADREGLTGECQNLLSLKNLKEKTRKCQ